MMLVASGITESGSVPGNDWQSLRSQSALAAEDEKRLVENNIQNSRKDIYSQVTYLCKVYENYW